MHSSASRLQMSIVWVLEILSMTHYLSLFILGNLVSIPLFLSLLFSPLFFLPIFYGIWMYYDYLTPFRGGRRIEFLRKLFIWKYVASYFPASLHKTADLDPTKNYIFLMHPHGILGISGFTSFVTEANDFSKKFPGITLHVLTLDVNFRLPLFREYIMGLGLGAVRQDSINHKLTKLGQGHSVLIVPGGAAEAKLSDPEKPYRLIIKKRKGFVREALKTGASLVPVFSFGESEIFHKVDPKPGSMYEKIVDLAHRYIRFVPLIFYGQFGPMPLRKQMHTVVGAPIDLPRVESPSSDEIDRWHSRYIEALKELFESNKERYGLPGHELELH